MWKVSNDSALWKGKGCGVGIKETTSKLQQFYIKLQLQCGELDDANLRGRVLTPDGWGILGSGLWSCLGTICDGFWNERWELSKPCGHQVVLCPRTSLLKPTHASGSCQSLRRSYFTATEIWSLLLQFWFPLPGSRWLLNTMDTEGLFPEHAQHYSSQSQHCLQ